MKESSEEVVNFFQNMYYNRLYEYLSFYGLWPYNQSLLQKFRTFCMFCYASHFLMLQISRLFTANGDINIVIDVLPTLSANLVIIIKQATIWMNMSAVKTLLDVIEHDWQSIYMKKEINVLEEYADKTRVLGKIYVFCIQSAVFILLLQQLSPGVLDVILPLNHSRPRRHIFEMEYFINKDDYYYPIVLHMLFSVQLGAWALIGADLIYLSSVLHACAVCDLVGLRIENAFHSLTYHNCKRNAKCLVRGKLKICVETHRVLIRYANTINSCYCNSYALQCAIAIISVTLILFRLFKSVISRDPSTGVVHVMYIIAFCLPLSFTMLSGQMLLNISTDLYHKVYCGKWYMICARSQKLLIIIMQMSRRPLELYILYYITLSFESLSMILRTAVSYFMVLLSVYPRS